MQGVCICERGGLRVAALVLFSLALAGPAGAAAPGPVWPAVEDLESTGKVSRFAYVDVRAVARTEPSWSARHVARLRLKTEDRTDELVAVVARTHDASGTAWLKVRLPVRPNGTTGWIPRTAVGQIRRVPTWLRINRRQRRLTLLRNGRIVFRARVGIGQRRWPTPAGTFFVRNRLQGRALGPIYGPLAFGTSARSPVLTDWPGGAVVGIHGTNRPGLIPGAVSHGCIRLRNRDVLRLGRLMPVGTSITIT